MNGANNLDQNGCEYGRMIRRDLDYIVQNLQHRPSWSTVALITLLSSLFTGIVVNLIT